MLGEEYGVSAGTSEFTWVIDPIDGTSPFVNGMPTWCISIAALRGEEIVVGVIYVPCNEELYASALGMGATLNGKALSIDPSKTIRNAVTGIGANHHVTPGYWRKKANDKAQVIISSTVERDHNRSILRSRRFREGQMALWHRSNQDPYST